MKKWWLASAAAAFTTTVAWGATSLTLVDGRYRVTATIEACSSSPAPLCAVIDKKGREEMTLTLEPSDWDAGLRSIAGLRAVLVGRVRKMTLKLSEAPKLFRDSVDHVAAPPAPYTRF